MDTKLELLSVPVTDVDRAKEFYVDKLGFNADHDHVVSDDPRFVQLTPARVGVLDLSDAAIRAELAERGVEAHEVDDRPWGRFVYFSDPDGNGWALQELPAWSQGAGGDGVNPND